MKITNSTPHKPTRLQQAVTEAMDSVTAEVEYRKLAVVEELLQYMKRNDIKKGELAKRMGVANSRVTALLSGDSNLTIDTLVRAGRAVDADLVQTFVPRGHKGVWAERKAAKLTKDGGIMYELQKERPEAVTLGVGSENVALEDSGRAA